MLLKKPTNKPLYTSCTGMLLIGLNDALLVPISWAGMEGAKGGFAVAQTEAAGPLLLFGVPMPWPIHCHAILQKGSSLKKMEMLKGLYARGVKVFRPALTETDNIYCVSVCQMRYVQGDFNFRQLSSYFVMISGMAKEKKKKLTKGSQMFLSLLDNQVGRGTQKWKPVGLCSQLPVPAAHVPPLVGMLLWPHSSCFLHYVRHWVEFPNHIGLQFRRTGLM